MIKTKEEIIESINKLIPEGSDDLTILEDVSDTLDSMKVERDPYEDKYNDLLKKYRERFTEVKTDEVVDKSEEAEIEVEAEEKITFDDLFKTE
ncbi:MAG: hypothetical protein J6Q89_07400 [Clostridia bacterium]|nr:hypothetical protein [Clostridia bacterium]